MQEERRYENSLRDLKKKKKKGLKEGLFLAVHVSGENYL